MREKLGSEERPLRVAVIGSGPAGFYAAEALLGAGVVVDVDMYDRLPAPFGLVRYGVAPDHENIKKVIKVYERTAAHAGYAFFGNVRVGEDVTVEELRVHYDAIIFACGAATDRRLGIDGEDLTGSYTATEFVAWYNGHPEYADRSFDLSHEVAVVIGQGNVAVDVARILCKTTDELKHTDIAAHALDALAKSAIREVHLVGRRGPVQAAFTPSEIKEFGSLADCDPVLTPADLELNPESQAELDNPRGGQARKNYEILREFAERPAPRKSRRLVVHFLESPVAIVGEERVERIVLEKNRLHGPSGGQKAAGTGVRSELACGAFFRSVGYRGIPMPGVPFDEKRGIFPNSDGRITDNGQTIGGLYTTGWIKRGPSGVIGTNKPDGIETVKSLLADLGELVPCAKPDRGAVLSLLAGKDVNVVGYGDWQRIDAAEIERGRARGKPREKFVTIDAMIAAAGLG
ncbi:MAG: FAD-dependent oxidoreductase [Candidatus Krumholzibacteriia bacterium]